MTTCGSCGATIPAGIPSGLCAWCSAVPYRLPSSADLAAFRASLNRANGGAWLRPTPEDGGALHVERAYGIGYQHPGDRSDRVPFDSERVNLRRGASAMRSREYAALFGETEPLDRPAQPMELAEGSPPWSNVCIPGWPL